MNSLNRKSNELRTKGVKYNKYYGTCAYKQPILGLSSEVTELGSQKPTSENFAKNESIVCAAGAGSPTHLFFFAVSFIVCTVVLYSNTTSMMKVSSRSRFHTCVRCSRLHCYFSVFFFICVFVGVNGSQLLAFFVSSIPYEHIAARQHAHTNVFVLY